MTEEEMEEEQYEIIRRENREERDRETHNMLRAMSDFINRYSVDFPLPWAVDAAKQVEEFEYRSTN